MCRPVQAGDHKGRPYGSNLGSRPGGPSHTGTSRRSLWVPCSTSSEALRPGCLFRLPGVNSQRSTVHGCPITHRPRALDFQAGDALKVSGIAGQEPCLHSSRCDSDGDIGCPPARGSQASKYLGGQCCQIFREGNNSIFQEKSPGHGQLFGNAGAAGKLVPGDRADLNSGFGGGQIGQACSLRSGCGESIDQEVGVQMDPH